MTGGCSVCQKTLKLDNIIDETRQGLASLLYIQCKCETTNKIFTSKRHFLKKNALIRQEYSILTHVVQEASVLYNLLLYWNISIKFEFMFTF